MVVIESAISNYMLGKFITGKTDAFITKIDLLSTSVEHLIAFIQGVLKHNRTLFIVYLVLSAMGMFLQLIRGINIIFS